MTRPRLHAGNDLRRALNAADGDTTKAVEELKALGWSVVRSEALPLSWLDRGHRHAEVCPGCQTRLSTVGLHKIAYVHDGCNCGTPEYTHLVEQLWHRKCLLAPEVRVSAEERSDDTKAPSKITEVG